MKGIAKENKSERVMVHVRMRPFSEDELKKDNTTPIETFDTANNYILVKKDYEKKSFSYDCIFSTTSTQKDVFEKSSRGVVESVLKGYNGTIFAYGQTGTGKTYTMVGDFENNTNQGVIPQAFEFIFEYIKSDTENKYNIYVSFIQIYLETIQDLLEPNNENIRIREDPDQGVYLEGVQWIKVSNTLDCKNLFLFGEKNRATASTKMNAHSSRSHAILVVKIEKSLAISPDKIKELTQESNEAILTDRLMTRSMLYLVDLAGSERVKKTKAEAMRLEEAKKINYSLLVLGNCIQSLTDPKSTHISYRDSKLTRLLQESLGGNAKTALIVTISPSTYNLDETLSSLNFGLRAMKVQNKPMVNKTVDYQALSIKLQEDLDKLNDQYAIIKIDYEKLLEENHKLKNSEVFLAMQRKSISNSLDSIDLEKVFERARTNNEKEKEKEKDDTNLAIEEIKQKCEEEIKKLENFYEEVLNNRITEHENILQQVDKVLFEKENEIETLTHDKKELSQNIAKLNETMNDLTKEKEDLQKSLIDSTNQHSKLQRTLEKNEHLTEQLQNENSNKSSVIEKLNEVINKKAKEIEDLNEKITLAEFDIKKLRVNSQCYMNNFESLKGEFADVDKSIKQFVNGLNLGMKSLNEYSEEFSKIEKLFEEEQNELVKAKSNARYDVFLSKFKEELERLCDLINDQEGFNLVCQSEEKYDEADISSTQDMVTTLSKTLPQISNQIGGIISSYYRLSKISHDMFQSLVTAYSRRVHERKSSTLELEYSKKNEFYIRNIILCLVQKLIEDLSPVVLPMSTVEDIGKKIETLSTEIINISAGELSKNSNMILDDLISRILLAAKEKDSEMENLNQRVSYFLKEIEIIKKSSSDSVSKTQSHIDTSSSSSKSAQNANLQIIKLNSQMKLKDDEIDRLNKRLEEHLKTIKQLTNELNIAKNTVISLNSIVPIDASNTQAGNSSSSHMSPVENIKKKMNTYEEEISSLRKIIDEQKNEFETEKSQLVQFRAEKMSKKDSSTGLYLLKEYHGKIWQFADDFLKFLES